MKMLRKYILLFILLLPAAAGFATPDRDSLVMKVIERGRTAIREMARQNKLNDEKGLSSQNRYVLRINTADLIDKKIDALDKDYIKQRKITYSSDDVGGNAAGEYLVPAGEDLDDLDDDLKEYNLNPGTKVRAYLITIDFIPMIFNNPPPDFGTLMSYYHNEAIGTENGTITETARDDAAAIVKGIAAGLLNEQADGSAPPAFNTVCCGMVNYKIYNKRDELKTLRIFSPYCDLKGDELESYNLLLGKHLMSVRGNTGPKMIEAFIRAIIRNNTDYKVLPYVKERIMSVTDSDEMGLLLSGLSENAYDQFTYEERMHAIKVLSSKGWINAPGQEKIVSLLSTADLETDAARLKEDLAKPNEYVPKTKEISDGGTDRITVHDDNSDLSLLHLLVNGISDQLLGAQSYTALTQFFINFARSSPTVFDDALAFYRDPNKLARTIVWDKSYALELLASPPVGTNSYDVAFDNKTDEITITKSQLKFYENKDGYDKLQEAMREYAKDNDTFLKKFMKETMVPATDALRVIGYYNGLFLPKPEWEEEAPLTLKPWDLVSFTNKSDLSLLAAAVGESAEQKDHQSQFVPAIVLKYAADKKLNKNVGKGVMMAFDVITLVTPVGELAYLGKVANYVYKGVEYGSKITALGNLAVETGAIPPDSKLAALIKDCYEVTNILQLGNLGLTATNGVIARLSRAEATKFLQSFYGAEKEGMIYLLKDPETVKRIIRFKREIEEAGVVAGYGKNWFQSIKDQVYNGVSATVAKMKDLKFLRTEGSGNLLKFMDGANQQVMHTMADGTVVLDKTAVTFAEDAHLVGTLDDVPVRTAENVSEATEDLMFIQRANKSVECIKGACFIAGTLVHTKAGLTPIEQVKDGETVLGVKVASGDTTWQQVTHAFTKHASKLVRIITGRDTIFSTPEHPYLTENGWKSAVDLKAGWRLRLAGHAFATLVSVVPIDTSVTVYNFETSITHNYCIGTDGIVVHNSCEIFKRLQSRIPEEHFDDFVNDFKDAPKGSEKASLLKKFDEGKLSIDVWEILYKYPSLRASEELYQFQGILKRSTDPNCAASMREVMAGNKGFDALNEVDRKAFRSRFEAIMLRAENKGDEALVTEMEKCLARLREVWAGEGIAARVARISKLADQYNALTPEQKLLFDKDFAEASPAALERIAGEPEFLAHWKTDREYYHVSYADMHHKDWLAVYNVTKTKGPLNGSLADALNVFTKQKNGDNFIAAAATYEGRPGGVVVRFNFDAPTEPPLIDMFRRRLKYMEIIREDAEQGGQLYKTLYKDVPLGKVTAADAPGTHAEVLAVNVIAREMEAATGVKLTAQSELSHISCMVRGQKYGSMCRCPHCFYILQEVNMIGNR